MTTEAITLPQLLASFFDYRLLKVHVAAPGKIKSYDASKRLAEVEVCTNPTDPGDTTKHVVRGVIKNVPIVFPGGGGYSLTFPLKAGDAVELVFQDYSIDQWLERGGVVDVVDTRNHHESDAMAFPGLHAKPDANLAASAENLVLGKDDDPSMQIVIDGSFIKLSANATKLVALAANASEWAARLHAIITGQSIPEAGNGANSSFQAALAAALTAPTPVATPSESAWGATKVKAE